MNETTSKTFTRIRNILKAGLWNFVFQIIFLVILFFAGYSVSLNFSPPLRGLLLAALILIPSIIWTVFFYIRDRLEPEPLSYIFISFLAGMSTAAIGILPIHRVLFRVHEWIYESVSLFIAGSFLVTAPIVCLLLYAVIRYGFYPLKEFDEPVDGMVYGAFTGCGIAFVLSIFKLWLNPDFTLFVIGYTATTQVLVYSGVGAVIGFMTGKAKFQKTSINRASCTGILLGTVLLGIYHLINEFIFVRGFSTAFWLSFILSLLYAFLILLFCTRTMQRLTKKDMHKTVSVTLKWDKGVIIIAVLFLIAGGITAHMGSGGKEFRDTEHGIVFRYPHSLSRFLSADLSPSLLPPSATILFTGIHKTSPAFSFSVMVHPVDEKEEKPDLITYMDVAQPENFTIKKIQTNNLKGQRLAYGYLQTTTASSTYFPVYKQVYKDIFSNEGKAFILTYEATAEHFQAGLEKYRNILKSIEWL